MWRCHLLTLLNKTYKLCVCEDCLTKKFPEYQTINKSRVFNRICDITNYAFKIDEKKSKEWKSKNYSITEKTLIEKYGEKNGKKRWKNYCDKQAYSNTYEYKKENHGWSKIEFSEYNKSRSVTLGNLIKKHGEEMGLNMWQKYIERQRYTCSKEYFLEEYGEIIGLEKYRNFVIKRIEQKSEFGYSEISQKIFEKVIQKLNTNYIYFYGDREKIFNNDLKYYLLDFYIEELDLGIEFNGDIWHGNPKMFNENDTPNPFDKKLLAKSIWQKDKIKIDFIKTKISDVIIVWESELKEKGLDKLTDELVNKIEKYEK